MNLCAVCTYKCMYDTITVAKVPDAKEAKKQSQNRNTTAASQSRSDHLSGKVVGRNNKFK